MSSSSNTTAHSQSLLERKGGGKRWIVFVAALRSPLCAFLGGRHLISNFINCTPTQILESRASRPPGRRYTAAQVCLSHPA